MEDLTERENPLHLVSTDTTHHKPLDWELFIENSGSIIQIYIYF